VRPPWGSCSSSYFLKCLAPTRANTIRDKRSLVGAGREYFRFLPKMGKTGLAQQLRQARVFNVTCTTEGFDHFAQNQHSLFFP
jgi:hypothetical protein